MNNYCIQKYFYKIRNNPVQWDDTSCKDEWQLEVYLHGLGLMKKYGLQSIIDIGCGSAYKLITYFKEYKTTGFEISPTFDWLQKHYPDRDWVKADFSWGERFSTDLVMCADVIEHLSDPDELLSFISKIKFKFLIISTPCRNLLYRRPWNKGYWGPPTAPGHIREWTYREFKNYIGSKFKIIDHRVTNFYQATQMIICRK